MSDYIKHNNSEISFNNSENWIVLNPIELSIKKKIEEHGTKLEDWDLSINRGILTGYNDAFIIDEATKNSLIESDSRSAELIRPILRGKDIKKYSYDFANLWIIDIPCGFTNINKKGKAEEWFSNSYNAIYTYLVKTEEELSKNRSAKSKGLYKRDDQGDYWWELRSCKYMDDFFEQNIAWQRITRENTFCLTRENTVILDSMAFINGAEEKTNYLLAVLNSSLVKFWMKKNVPEYGSSGYRFSNQFVTQIPIPYMPNQEIKSKIEEYVNLFFEGKDTTAKIDELVYKLYNLKGSEIDYIKLEKYLSN